LNQAKTISELDQDELRRFATKVSSLEENLNGSVKDCHEIKEKMVFLFL
jgi:hypothetical protein